MQDFRVLYYCPLLPLFVCPFFFSFFFGLGKEFPLLAPAFNGGGINGFLQMGKLDPSVKLVFSWCVFKEVT
jgi:hypothetical protein